MHTLRNRARDRNGAQERSDNEDMPNGIVTRPPVQILPKSSLVERGVSGRSFTVSSLAAFAKGHVLKLKPGSQLSIYTPNSKTFDALEGVNANSPFTVVSTRDLNRSSIRIGVKPGAKVGASDVMTAVAHIASPQHPTMEIKARFKLVVASRKDT